MSRADALTASAVDTFMVAHMADIHLAVRYAGAASCAFVLIHLKTNQREAAEESIQSAERT